MILFRARKVFPSISRLTLFRTMQSAALTEEDYRVPSYSFGASEAWPMQQLPMRPDANVLFQLKERITDSVIMGIVRESSEWPIAS